MLEWHKYHTFGQDLVNRECFDLFSWPYEAHIDGSGQDWRWRAFVWATNDNPRTAKASAEGLALDADSAKDFVRRFFEDVAKAS